MWGEQWLWLSPGLGLLYHLAPDAHICLLEFAPSHPRKEEASDRVKKKKNLLLSADTSMFPSLMRSLMNLLVLSNSISWHCSRSLNSGLSKKESLNSSVGSPMVTETFTAGY